MKHRKSDSELCAGDYLTNPQVPGKHRALESLDIRQRSNAIILLTAPITDTMKFMKFLYEIHKEISQLSTISTNQKRTLAHFQWAGKGSVL
jgi:hypothetical protein